MIAMKINAIKNINYKPFKLNKNRQTFKTQNDSFELSFSARIKHSKDFLEITKNNKDIRSYLTSLCMLDEEGNFNEIAQDTFVEYYHSLKAETTQNERDFLTSIALALKLSEENDYLEFPQHLAQIEVVKEDYNLSNEEIRMLFSPENYDFNLPHAYTIIKTVYEDTPSNDIVLFLTRYCKTKENLTDITVVENLCRLFNLMGVKELDMADSIYSIVLDENNEVNCQKCKFMTNAITEVFKYCAQESNSYSFVVSQPKKAKNLLILAMKNLIQTAQAQNKGKFDYNIAIDSFNAWFEYAIKNQDEINNQQKVAVYDSKDLKVKEISISQVVKKYPNVAADFDNTLYRFSSILANFSDDIEQ